MSYPTRVKYSWCAIFVALFDRTFGEMQGRERMGKCTTDRTGRRAGRVENRGEPSFPPAKMSFSACHEPKSCKKLTDEIWLAVAYNGDFQTFCKISCFTYWIIQEKCSNFAIGNQHQ